MSDWLELATKMICDHERAISLLTYWSALNTGLIVAGTVFFTLRRK